MLVVSSLVLTALGCGGDNADEAAPGLREPTASTPTTNGIALGLGPHRGPCLERPGSGPALDWLPTDLPLPPGAYPVDELALDPKLHSFRAATLVVPMDYTEFFEFAETTWPASGWTVAMTESEPGEIEASFLRPDEIGGFRARHVYCEEGWAEVGLALDRPSSTTRPQPAAP